MVFALQQKISFLGDKNFQFFTEIHGDDHIKKNPCLVDYRIFEKSLRPVTPEIENAKFEIEICIISRKNFQLNKIGFRSVSQTKALNYVSFVTCNT